MNQPFPLKALHTFYLAIIIACTALPAWSQVDWSSTNKTILLQSILDGQPTDYRSLKQALPSTWLEPTLDVEKEKALTKEKLDTARTENHTEQITLHSLELDFLNLTNAKRQMLLKKAQEETQLLLSREQTQKLTQEALADQRTQKQNQAQLKEDLQNTTSTVEKELLLEAQALETGFIHLTQTKAFLASEKGLLLDTIQKQRTILATTGGLLQDIQRGISRNHQAWMETLKQSERALKQSNNRIRTQAAFSAAYSPKKLQPYERSLSKEQLERLEILPGDHPLRQKLIQYRQRKSLYKTELLLLDDALSGYHKDMIVTEKALREAIMETRSTILTYEYRNHWQSFQQLRSPLETVALEGSTLISQGLFQAWTLRNALFKNTSAELPILKKIWRLVMIGFRWGYVALILFMGTWLLRNKRKWIKQMRVGIEQMITPRKNKKRLHWALDLLNDFYLFILVGILGVWFIRLAVQAGFSKATFITPYITLFMVYFLGKGLLEAFVPVISQRKHGTYGKEKGEVLAIESTFRLIPFYILTYWAIGRAIGLFLEQNLIFSETHQWIQTAWWFGLLPMLFVGVYRNRLAWRRTCVYVSDHARWRTILEKSKDRIWEPLILLVGGGAGVYLIAWRRIGLRVVEARVTRSFQAMVSRAVYERAKKNKIVRINFEDLPNGYANAFGRSSVWKPEWHIEQTQYQEKLHEYFEAWQQSNDGKTILIYGERGIGKSALIHQWLHKVDQLHHRVRFTQQDHSREHLLKTVSEGLLGRLITDEKELVDTLNQIEPTVFVLERLEDTVLRKVGGLDGFSLLLHLMLRAKNHFWVTSINLHTWGFIQHGSLGVNCFSHYIHMEGMEEKDIQSMILNRHQSFDSELNFQALANTTGKIQTGNETYEKEKELYFRILWDYTRGNPREAMYFWGTSVRVNENRTSVSLFDIPESEVLSTLSTPCLDVLACIIEHNGIGMNELVQILDIPVREMDRLIERLDSFGMLYRVKDFGTLHVEAFWYRSVSNYLVRRNMIFKGEHIS